MTTITQDRFKKLAVGAAMVSLSALAAQNAVAGPGTGAMSAVILEPVTVSGTQVLHFGDMTVQGSAGTRTIAPDGTVNAPTGGVTAVDTINTPQRGQILISGATSVDIQVAVDTATINLTDGAGNSMTVNNFLIEDPTAPAQTITTQLTGTSSTARRRGVGATLTVPSATQPDGTYTGVYNLSVSYI